MPRIYTFEERIKIHIRQTDQERLDNLKLTPGQLQHAQAQIILSLVIIDEMNRAEANGETIKQTEDTIWQLFQNELKPVVLAYQSAGSGTEEEFNLYIQKIRDSFTYFEPKVMNILFRNIV
jgi:hypothetical protein